MLVSPSGPTRPERVARGVELLTGWGLRVGRWRRRVRPRRATWPDGRAARRRPERRRFADPAVRGVDLHPGRLRRAADSRRDRHGRRAAPTRRWWSGFSDITALQLRALARRPAGRRCTGRGRPGSDERTAARSAESLRDALMTTEPVTVERGRRRGDLRGYGVHRPGQGPALRRQPLPGRGRPLGTPDMPDLTRGDAAARGGRASRPTRSTGCSPSCAAPGSWTGWPGWRWASSPTARTTGRSARRRARRAPRRPGRAGARRPADRSRARPAHRPGGIGHPRRGNAAP